MRILISNPDTIGDVVLRQPLFRALLDAGHELALIVRPLVQPLLPLIAPGARVLSMPVHIYDPALGVQSESLASAVREARSFKPELFVIAPFQWTVFEERLSLELQADRVPTAVMTGRLFGDPSFGPAPPSGLRQPRQVQVVEEMPELRKNEQLASALLERAVTLPDPRLEATPAQLDAARAELSRTGLKPGEFWVACVGETSGTAVRNWRPSRWAEVLSTWHREFGRRFLFIGHESEAEAARAVRERMADARGCIAEWFPAGDGYLDLLVGLIALSGGYVGRDTGPMHLAAALGRPVLAVFGGGTWPRFVPSVDPSVSVTVGVPCAGCNWLCHLEDSYCIKEVPVSEVLEAARGLERGMIKNRQVRVLAADDVLMSRIGREGAMVARERLTLLSVSQRTGEGKGQSVTDRAAIDGTTDDLPLAAPSTAELKPWAGAPESAAQRLQAELNRTRQELGKARARIAELEVAAGELGRVRAEQAGQILSVRQLHAEAKARIELLERKIEEKVNEIVNAKADAAGAREHAKIKATAEASLRQQLDQARLSLMKAQEDLAARNRRIEELSALESRLRTAEEVGTEASRAREAKLREQLHDARTRLTEAEGRLRDQRVRLSRHEHEQTTLQKLATDRDAEIVVLRGRLRDLMASRWRKLGQRLHLAMTLPWERESDNGRAS